MDTMNNNIEQTTQNEEQQNQKFNEQNIINDIFNKNTLQSFFVEMQNVLELSLQSLMELAIIYEKELELQQKNLDFIIKQAEYLYKNQQMESPYKELTEEELSELEQFNKQQL